MTAPTIEFRILGPLEVRSDEGVVPLGGPRPRALLAALLLEANRVVSVDRLLEAVWGESPPASGAHALAVYISTLRKALGGEYLRREGDGYVLRVAGEQLDARCFESLLGEGRRQLEQGRASRAARALRAALDLWRGPALGELADADFARAEAERLQELRLVAVQARIDADLSLGRHDELVAELEGLVVEHPLDERFQAQLMLALYRSGRQADALGLYRRVRTLMAEELGLEPGPELRELERRVLNQDPALVLGWSSVQAGFLPTQVTSFVDRRAEQVEVCGLLARDDVRLATLTGPGGVGKTRLALAAAETLADDYPDGVWFVDLSPIRDPGLLIDAIARALESKIELRRYLADKRLLVLLDNFEQLLDAAPEVTGLLRACPGLDLLVTSRERLRVSGEHLYDVPPLHEPEAIALFSARARAVDHRFEPDHFVSLICRRLDGLPLAIELAAARLADFTTSELLEQLDRRLPVLSEGPRDAPARQQTLRATIDWSHVLLSADEQRLFARLAVFTGGCTEEAAAEICDAEPYSLQALAEKNLLRQHSERFTMLETVRDYARELLEAGVEADTLRERHADWCAGLLEQAFPELREGDQRIWLERLEPEHDNVRAALDFSHANGLHELELRLAASAGPFWYMRSHLSEGRLRLRRALEHTGGAVGLRARALQYEALFAFDQGDADAANRLTSDLLHFADQLDPYQLAEVHAIRAGAVLLGGDVPGALDSYGRALELSREAGYVWMVRVALNSLGCVLMDAGDPEGAKRYFEEALALEPERDHELTAAACLNLAWLAAEANDVEQTRACLGAALRILIEIGTRNAHFAADALVIAAWAVVSTGDPGAALRLLGAAGKLEAETGAIASPSLAPLRERADVAAREVLAAKGEELPSGEPFGLEDAIAFALERLRTGVSRSL